MATTFIITPLIFFGGVFHSISMVPGPLRWVTIFNPMFYLVNGMRYSITGVGDVSVWICLAFAVVMAAVMFLLTVYLFKIGYKLRT